MSEQAPILLWFRRDLRLDDSPMLFEAAATGRPILPVALPEVMAEGLGAAAAWRYGRALEAFAARLKDALG
ncbi:deoxyribodipyrimidine photo-lyase, partial [Thioclava sp. BHET1]